jgi:hypothetical protein
VTCTRLHFARAAPSGEQNLEDSIELAAVSPCFDRQSLAEEIERWLERETVDARLRVRVTRTPESLSFSIRLGQGVPLVREFAQLPPDCAGERSALALSIALAIDALAPQTEPPRPEDRWLLSLGAAFGTNGAGSPLFGVQAALATKLAEPLWLQLSVLGTQQKGLPLTDGTPAEYDDSRLAARLGGCGVAAIPSRLHAAACVGPELGATMISGHGFEGASTETRIWWAIGLSLELHVHFSSQWGVHVTADGTAWPFPGTVQVLDSQGDRVVARDLPAFAGLVQIGPSIFF